MTVGFPILTSSLAQPGPRTPAVKPGGGTTFGDAMAEVTAPDPKLVNAAKQFEALIMGQVLKTARESSDGGWLGTGEDQTGSMAVEMAEQQFAQALTTGRGLGLANFVTDHLNRKAAATAASSGPGDLHPLTPAGTAPPE